MDPLSRCARSSVSDLAGLIGGESDYSSDANSSFGASLQTPPPPAPTGGATAAALVNEAADSVNGSGGSPEPRMGHPASVADSLCRSDTGTNEFSVGGDDEASDTTLLAECLRRFIHLDGINASVASAAAAATADTTDCCVYANCNCGPLPQPPPSPAGKTDSDRGAGGNTIARRISAAGSCKCCCVS